MTRSRNSLQRLRRTGAGEWVPMGCFALSAKAALIETHKKSPNSFTRWAWTLGRMTSKPYKAQRLASRPNCGQSLGRRRSAKAESLFLVRRPTPSLKEALPAHLLLRRPTRTKATSFCRILILAKDSRGLRPPNFKSFALISTSVILAPRWPLDSSSRARKMFVP